MTPTKIIHIFAQLEVLSKLEIIRVRLFPSTNLSFITPKSAITRKAERRNRKQKGMKRQKGREVVDEATQSFFYSSWRGRA